MDLEKRVFTVNNGYEITASLPLRLADLVTKGNYAEFNKASIYIVGTMDNDGVRILYPARSESAV